MDAPASAAALAYRSIIQSTCARESLGSRGLPGWVRRSHSSHLWVIRLTAARPRLETVVLVGAGMTPQPRKPGIFEKAVEGTEKKEKKKGWGGEGREKQRRERKREGRKKKNHHVQAWSVLGSGPRGPGRHFKATGVEQVIEAVSWWAVTSSFCPGKRCPGRIPACRAS